jgi:phage terminase large subunit
MLERTRWAPDYRSMVEWRQEQRVSWAKNPTLLRGARDYYRRNPADWIHDWCNTYDPRNAGVEGKSTNMPFALFPRQREFIHFLQALLLEEANGLIEKSRDMGATWGCIAFSAHQFCFVDGSATGWGSRKSTLVDRIGDMNSIFEKKRMLFRNLPPEFYPRGFDPDQHMSLMKIYSPRTDSSITGEGGDDIGRGGRTRIYFKDESAHYEHPEAIEAALADNTRVQVDISSVNGLNNVFHRKRESGVEWTPGSRPDPGRTNVFIMDWRDHPDKTQAWHDRREQHATENGLLHIFRQEVDRDYSASISGVIIPSAWVRSAIDADKKLGIKMDDGGHMAGLDVADGDTGRNDTNALAKRKGVKLNLLDEWGERDTGTTARRAVAGCEGTLPIEVQYDSIGVGAGVKAETNRLKDERLMPKGMKFISWDAGSGVLNPEEHVNPGDKETPLNEDFYGNLKAQAWWQLRRRFERTHRMVQEKLHPETVVGSPAKYPVDELICIDGTLPKLRSLEKELSQPTSGKSARMKLIVNKTPEGTKSPNLADAVVMCYFPAVEVSSYDGSLSWVSGRARNI